MPLQPSRLGLSMRGLSEEVSYIVGTFVVEEMAGATFVVEEVQELVGRKVKVYESMSESEWLLHL